MGLKQSKRADPACRVSLPPRSWAVACLDRVDMSGEQVENHRLPGEVLALILSHLELRDLGRAARVCKTWRTVLSEDFVWREMARRMQLQPAPRDDCRVLLLLSCLASHPDFVRAPVELPSLALTPAEKRQWVRVLLVAPSLPQQGVGKSALFARFCRRLNCTRYPTLASNGAAAVLQERTTQSSLVVNDSNCERLPLFQRHESLRWGHVVLICSPFDREGAFRAAVARYEECVRWRRAGVAVVLVRTKADLQLPFPEAGRVLQWAEQHGVGFVNTSSKTGRNVTTLFALAAHMHWGRQRQKAMEM